MNNIEFKKLRKKAITAKEFNLLKGSEVVKLKRVTYNGNSSFSINDVIISDVKPSKRSSNTIVGYTFPNTEVVFGEYVSEKGFNRCNSSGYSHTVFFVEKSELK